MSFHALTNLGVTVRPLQQPRPKPMWRRSMFSATLNQTCRLLERELRHLQAKRIVLELDLRDRDIRLDGLPRADARPADPTVALAFESKHGPLRYTTGEYHDWRDNLRAIALSMEALRTVDRYGVSRRGEQYVGWKALPTSTDPAAAIQTEEQAHAVLATYDNDIKRALRETHPDTGGDATEFRKVLRAREILGV